MLSKKRPLIINDIKDMGESYYKPFRFCWGDVTENYKVLEYAPDSVSHVIFCGGSDVTPFLYNDGPSSLSYCDPDRDEFEVSIFKKALLHKIPMLGICRGAQFLCAMAGGKLFQHVNGHNGKNHFMLTRKREMINVNSYHHQMLRPPESAEIVAWCDPPQSNIYIGSNDHEMPKPEFEPEIVYFPNINALGIQYHPETMSIESMGYEAAGSYAKHYLG